MTARNNSSVCKLPFISISAFDLMDQLDRFRSCGFGVVGFYNFEIAYFQAVFACFVFDLR